MYTLLETDKNYVNIYKYLGKEFTFIAVDSERYIDAFKHFNTEKYSKGYPKDNIIALIVPETFDKYIPVYSNKETIILNERGEVFMNLSIG